jgi:hypothetical protein
MRFVHSLVKSQQEEKKGWYAPIELGETAPHYIGFAIPVGDRLDERYRDRLDERYTCEIVRVHKGEREIIPRELIRTGKDSFVLTIDERELWFVVRPMSRDRRLPYLGKLEHEDFGLLFTEIEPEDPTMLDQLFLEKGVGILGCDPFTHYRGVTKFSQG